MDMKAKSALIRKLRSEKLWSQEQLAKACGLSLRTIQRIENSGSASIETIKALSAVFSINPDDLVWSEGGFEVYRHVQRADFILITLGTVSVLMLSLSLEYPTFPTVIVSLFFFLIGILTILFYSLTIEVNESYVTWYFGPGFWRKRINLDQIEDCSTVKNPWWWGFGIRAFGSGWLYCVSGLLAVELNLKSGSKIRLGTDEPKFLKTAIQDAIDNAL